MGGSDMGDSVKTQPSNVQINKEHEGCTGGTCDWDTPHTGVFGANRMRKSVANHQLVHAAVSPGDIWMIDQHGSYRAADELGFHRRFRPRQLWFEMRRGWFEKLVTRFGNGSHNLAQAGHWKSPFAG